MHLDAGRGFGGHWAGGSRQPTARAQPTTNRTALDHRHDDAHAPGWFSSCTRLVYRRSEPSNRRSRTSTGVTFDDPLDLGRPQEPEQGKESPSRGNAATGRTITPSASTGRRGSQQCSVAKTDLGRCRRSGRFVRLVPSAPVPLATALALAAQNVGVPLASPPSASITGTSTSTLTW